MLDRARQSSCHKKKIGRVEERRRLKQNSAKKRTPKHRKKKMKLNKDETEESKFDRFLYTLDSLEGMRVKALKRLVHLHGLDCTGCKEKSEFVQLLSEVEDEDYEESVGLPKEEEREEQVGDTYKRDAKPKKKFTFEFGKKTEL
jgi:hypothetical protein